MVGSCAVCIILHRRLLHVVQVDLYRCSELGGYSSPRSEGVWSYGVIRHYVGGWGEEGSWGRSWGLSLGARQPFPRWRAPCTSDSTPVTRRMAPHRLYVAFRSPLTNEEADSMACFIQTSPSVSRLPEDDARISDGKWRCATKIQQRAPPPRHRGPLAKRMGLRRHLGSEWLVRRRAAISWGFEPLGSRGLMGS